MDSNLQYTKVFLGACYVTVEGAMTWSKGPYRTQRWDVVVYQDAVRFFFILNAVDF